MKRTAEEWDRLEQLLEEKQRASAQLIAKNTRLIEQLEEMQRLVVPLRNANAQLGEINIRLLETVQCMGKELKRHDMKREQCDRSVETEEVAQRPATR